MYEFIDVNAESGYSLPAEALKINGEYIENVIDGYRTLHVSGREALSPDVESFSTGNRDGTRRKYKRYPERIITVTYQLCAESSEAYREAYNRLGGILNIEDAELIFNDEQDKYFIGTPCIIGAVEPGKNSVVGEFEIICTDPFKYSVIEYEATPAQGDTSLLINYNGTYKAFPTLQAEFYSEDETSPDGALVNELTGRGDCGYVAFFSDNEKSIQLGKPDEIDGESTQAPSQTLVNSLFKTASAWEVAAQSLWTVNNGAVADAEQSGIVGMGVASYSAAAAAETSGTLLTTASTVSSPTINYKITAKASNRTADSVKVVFSITSWLHSDAAFFGTGYGLTGRVYINGSWLTVTLKSTSASWRGKSAHTVNLTVTVTGLAASTATLTGIKFKVTRSDSSGSAGTLRETACKNLTIPQYADNVPDTYFLTSTSYGSGNGWHGPSITREIPAGTLNCTLSFSQELSIGNSEGSPAQYGAFQALLTTGSGQTRVIVAGLSINKSVSGASAKAHFYLNGIIVGTADIDASYDNDTFGIDRTTSINKSGETVTFTVGGLKKSFRDAALAATSIDGISFSFLQYGASPVLAKNGLYWAKFVKDGGDSWNDIPNVFSANDTVVADCRSGKIYLNGAETPALGALGNEWEEFVLKPGLNQISFAYSDWVDDEYAPVITVRYREVYL